MPYEGPGTILGGLPVIAVVESGYYPGTPVSEPEWWSEIVAIYWRGRDGQKRGEIPEHIRYRAEKYDYAFCDLIEQVHDHLAYERWMQQRRDKLTAWLNCDLKAPDQLEELR